MLINETKPLGTNGMLESELLERELEHGVFVDQGPFVDENSEQTVLGGLVTAHEHVTAREARFDKPADARRASLDEPAGKLDLLK